MGSRRYGRWIGALALSGGCTPLTPDLDPSVATDNAGFETSGTSGENEGGDTLPEPARDVGVPEPIERPASEACRPLDPTVSTYPQTIEETISLINALPKPLSLGCFIESLDRPLGVNATTSVFSAQPAAGERSPRLFLMMGNLILSIVPEGDGSLLLEFGEFVSERQTLKGELVFPVEDTLPVDAAYERVLFNEGQSTVCGFCHRGEYSSDLHPGGFISEAFRPAYWSVVELEWVELQWRTCDANLEPDRCAILDGVFGRGEVHEEPFSPDLSIFFE